MGEDVVKEVTERFRNSRESLVWWGSHPGGAVFLSLLHKMM